MVGLSRLELPTSRLSGVRSNHLSYRPLKSSPLFNKEGRSPKCQVQILPGSNTVRENPDGKTEFLRRLVQTVWAKKPYPKDTCPVKLLVQ